MPAAVVKAFGRKTDSDPPLWPWKDVGFDANANRSATAVLGPHQTMTDDTLKSLPARRGHFLLESGYHTDIWFNLDGLFLDPNETTRRVVALAELFRPYEISAVCGPLLGGAFLAQAVAAHMGVRFYYTQRAQVENEGTLFSTVYRLPSELRKRVGGERVAIVDDMISAGSSVRATTTELTAAGAVISVVGTLMLLGHQAVEHFSTRGIPVVAVAKQEFNLWPPPECGLCKTGIALEDPTLH